MPGIVTALLLFFCSAVVALGMWGCPKYEVYQQELVGQAEYERNVSHSTPRSGKKKLKRRQGKMPKLLPIGLRITANTVSVARKGKSPCLERRTG
ncbi:hypothetical protein LJC46_08275 [Desulfovibrio sp. OttesenSCG-928-G15]|nr:hypothetical protein [Desulfovibrio sp. OttesenSCG-928-G15]